MDEKTDWDALVAAAAELQSVRVLDACKANLAHLRETRPAEMAMLMDCVGQILETASHRGVTPVSGALAVLTGPEILLNGADVSSMGLRGLMQAVVAIVAEWQENILAGADR